MTRQSRKHLLVAVLAGLALLASPMAALAVLELTISGAVPTFTCVNGAACDTNPAPNAVSITLGNNGVPPAPGGIVGGTNTTISAALVGSSSLDLAWTLNSVGSTGNLGNPLIIVASNTGYPSPSGPATETMGINGNFAIGSGSISALNCDDSQNRNFTVPPLNVSGTTCLSLGPFTSGGFGASSSVGLNQTTPFSLNDQLSLQIAANTITSGDMFSTVTGNVPEPSTILLLGAGLAGLQGFVWRRGRRK